LHRKLSAAIKTGCKKVEIVRVFLEKKLKDIEVGAIYLTDSAFSFTGKSGVLLVGDFKSRHWF